jgi:hypothetical protein
MRPDGPRDPVAGPDDGPVAPFPLRLSGKVIKGFGRGSKEVSVSVAAHVNSPCRTNGRSSRFFCQHILKRLYSYSLRKPELLQTILNETIMSFIISRMCR